LPAQAAGITQDWPTVSQICRVTRSRQRRVKGVWQEQQETAYLITSLTKDEASPEYLLNLNRKHWGIEIMHRNKDVVLGEDGYTNRLDNAPPKCLLAHRPRPQTPALSLTFTHKGNRVFPGQPKSSHTNDSSGLMNRPE